MKKYIIGTLVTVLVSSLFPVQVFAVESFDKIFQFIANIF